MSSTAPNPVPAPTQAQALERLLHAQRARLRGRYLVHGAGYVCAALALVLGVYYALDRWLHLPVAVRLVLSAGTVLYLLSVARRRLLYPWRRPLARDDIAIAIERRFPELHEELISAVQLQEVLTAGGRDPQALRNQSPALIERIVVEADQRLAQVPIERLLDPRRTRRLWAFAGAVMLCLLGTFAANLESTGVFARRVLGASTPYPRETSLFVELDDQDPDLRIARQGTTAKVTLAAGSDLVVVVRAEGVVPRDVMLVVSGTRGTAPQIAMSGKGGGRFRHVFRRVAGAMTFHARGGDDDRGDLEVQVQVVRPPSVATLRATITPPEYAQRDVQVQAGGALEALEGSKVVLDVFQTEGEAGGGTASSCKLVFLESGRQIETRLAQLADDAGQKQVFRGEFVIDRSDRYQVELVGEKGLRNPHPGTYSVVAVPDYAPVGRLLLPAEDSLNVVLPHGIVPIRAELKDDLGLAAARAEILIGKNQTPVSVPLLATKPGDPPLREAIPLHFFDLAGAATATRASQGLAGVGETILVGVEVRDKKPPEGTLTKLPGRQLHVVGDADFARRVAGHFRSIREDVERALALQQERLDKNKDLLDDARAEAAPGGLQGILTAAGAGQSRVLAASERIHRELMRSFDLHLFNRVDASIHATKVLELFLAWHRANPAAESFQPAFYTLLAGERRAGRLGAMEKALDPILDMLLRAQTIALETAPAAGRHLTEALVAKDSETRRVALQQATARQGMILEALKALLARLDEWNEFQDVITQTRAVRDKQRDVQSRTRTLTGGKEK